MATILWVDDEPEMQEVHGENLHDEYGHSVIAVTTLDEALRAAKATRFDLLVTDKNLGAHRGILLPS